MLLTRSPVGQPRHVHVLPLVRSSSASKLYGDSWSLQQKANIPCVACPTSGPVPKKHLDSPAARSKRKKRLGRGADDLRCIFSTCPLGGQRKLICVLLPVFDIGVDQLAAVLLYSDCGDAWKSQECRPFLHDPDRCVAARHVEVRLIRLAAVCWLHQRWSL